MILTSRRLWTFTRLEKWALCAQERDPTTVLVFLHVHKATQYCHLLLLFRIVSYEDQMVTKGTIRPHVINGVSRLCEPSVGINPVAVAIA